MRQCLIGGILVAVLIVSLAATPPASVKATATTAATGVPPQLTSGAQVDAYLTQANFHGYILQERHGRTLLSKGYGMADMQQKVPITAQTRWPMFGVETFMIAMVMLKLQEDGKLKLQDRLCMYLAGCPADWRALALRGLLDGTSDIGSYDPFANPGSSDHTIAQCKGAPMLSAPPGVAEDSSCNRVLLSRIIERVTHKPFAAVMQQLIFRPAGMTATSIVNSVPPQSARGYTSGALAPAVHVGGYPLIYSTPGDVQRLDRALLAGKIIAQQSVRALITPYRPDAPDPGLTVYDAYGCQALKANLFFFPSVGMSLPLKSNRVVFENGGPDWSGIMIDNFLSPDDGTIQIEMVNDSGLFDYNADNAFMERTAQLLWGR